MISTKKQAEAQIQTHLDNAKNQINQAEKLADEHGVSFYFSVEYGMGGTYYPPKKPVLLTRQEAIERLAADDYLSEAEIESLRGVLKNTRTLKDSYNLDWNDSSYDSDYQGWVSSGNNC